MSEEKSVGKPSEVSSEGWWPKLEAMDWLHLLAWFVAGTGVGHLSADYLKCLLG